MILCHLIPSVVLATSCQVCPSEYAYRKDFVTAHGSSANCRAYQQGIDQPFVTEDYIHCNGTHHKLADSFFGSKQYRSSDYYWWPAGTSNRNLLFTFPTRVNLITITLHYSDSERGLPRLRFSAVPDDFNIWKSPPASHSYTTAAVIGEEPKGPRSVSVNVNFNSTRILLSVSNWTSMFAVSEIEFFNCSHQQGSEIQVEYTTQASPSTTATHAVKFISEFRTTNSKIPSKCY